MSISFDLSALADAPIGGQVQLPTPARRGGLSVEDAIARRRSVRAFAADPLDLGIISQLLWAAQGLTSPEGQRAAPSAGACYPLALFLLCAEGVFRYDPGSHALTKAQAEDVRAALADAALGQHFVAEAPVVLVFAATYERTTSRYGERGRRYVHIDLGHAGQNVHLQAVSLGLASVPVGAFHDDAVARVLQLPRDQKPVYVIPVGLPRV
jgi:SagB-type dehydrogenase family enzyme